MKKEFEKREKGRYGGSNTRQTGFMKLDRSKLPFHRFVKWLMENELSKKYLVAGEGVIVALLAATIYLYYFR